MRCQLYTVSPLAMLSLRPRRLSPTAFFQQWSSAPSGAALKAGSPPLDCLIATWRLQTPVDSHWLACADAHPHNVSL